MDSTLDFMKTMNLEQMECVSGGWSWRSCAEGAAKMYMLAQPSIMYMSAFGGIWGIGALAASLAGGCALGNI